MAEKTYSEKLLDIRWQKKRVEILVRDKWTCKKCGNGDRTMHVHHNCEYDGRDPWEYPENLLETLCCFCHKGEHPESEKQYAVATEEQKILWRLLPEKETEEIKSINSQIESLREQLLSKLSESSMYLILGNISDLQKKRLKLLTH